MLPCACRRALVALTAVVSLGCGGAVGAAHDSAADSGTATDATTVADSSADDATTTPDSSAGDTGTLLPPGDGASADGPSTPPPPPLPPYDAGASCSSNCGGCCDGTTCYPSGASETAACGALGAPCIACEAGSICRKGTCYRPQPNCGPSNCPGCCLDANTCASGLDDHACGTQGQACQGCAINGAGACVPQPGGGGLCHGVQTCMKGNCTGCCNGDVCELGTSDSACGSAAGVCVACASGQSCVNGECQSPPFCTAQSCSTCCAGNQCAPGDTDQACGLGSQVCQDCASQGLVCKNHRCVTGCSPATCSGCCQGDVCAAGNQDLACGSGGQPCADCTQYQNLTCSGNMCVISGG